MTDSIKIKKTVCEVNCGAHMFYNKINSKYRKKLLRFHMIFFSIVVLISLIVSFYFQLITIEHVFAHRFFIFAGIFGFVIFRLVIFRSRIHIHRLCLLSRSLFIFSAVAIEKLKRLIKIFVRK